ncbi:MAG: hypothetical protein OXC69_06550 [Candidatus Tectomicrobia bacterium]|nr:hypothetical protein [Candidatus Tectomicrobia bacterium]
MSTKTIAIATIALALGGNYVFANGHSSSENYRLPDCTEVDDEQCKMKGFFVDSKQKTELEILKLSGGLEPFMRLSHKDGPGYIFCYDHVANTKCDGCADTECVSAHPYQDPVLGVAGIFEYVGEVDTCRDSISGRDHIIIESVQAGTIGSPYISVFSFQSSGKDVNVEYVEGLSSWDGERPNLRDLEGTCNWRDRQAARKVISDGMAVLRLEDRPDTRRTSAWWPTREIPNEEAHKALLALADTQQNFAITIEGAVYATDGDHVDWRVLQILDETRPICESQGVVLVQNRRMETWRAVYNIPADCNSLFPMKNMIVKDNKLFAWVCTACDWFHNGWNQDYAYFMIELQESPRNLPATLLVHPRMGGEEGSLLGDVTDLPELLRQSVHLGKNREIRNIYDEIR